MGRSRRFVKLRRHRDYKDFSIRQADPNAKKLGVGPYVLLYKEREVLRKPRHSECHDELEKIVSEKWRLDAEINKLKRDFCAKWGLKDFPESA